MTIQEFIEKIPKEIRLNSLGICKPLPELVLDIRVWEAVGKSLNWGYDKAFSFAGKATQKTKRELGKKLGMDADWKYIMREMIDHLCNGGNIESYLKTL